MQWEGNNSKRYDHAKEEVWLTSIVAINATPVIDPTIDQLSVGDRIESEYVYKKGWVQVWKGIVVSVDPDAERRAGKATTSPGRKDGGMGGRPTKEDTERRARKSPTNAQQVRNKGKAKQPSPSEGPQQKRMRRSGA